MDYIYAILDYFVLGFNEVRHFITGVPEFIIDIFAYGWFWAIKFYITFKISMIVLAYNVAGLLLENYEVYTVLNVLFNNLSPDIRHILFELGMVDAIRIIIDAMATAFVLRIMGW